MALMTSIKDLLRKHGYQVRVTKIDKGHIQADFPQRREYPFCLDFSVSYNLNSKTSVGIKSEVGQEHTIKAPRYAHRSIVLADIFQLCSTIYFNYSLIDFYDSKDVVTAECFYDNMLSSPLTNNQMEKDRVMSELTERCLLNGPSPELTTEARLKGVLAGYEIVGSILFGDTDE